MSSWRHRPCSTGSGEAEHLVTNRDLTPALAPTGRSLLIETLDVSRRALERTLPSSRSSMANPTRTSEMRPGGPVFIDFETCCRGPIEFDVAHVPVDVAAGYPGLDLDLLQTCRRLVLAMVAAWRWDATDQFLTDSATGRTSSMSSAAGHRGRPSTTSTTSEPNPGRVLRGARRARDFGLPFRTAFDAPNLFVPRMTQHGPWSFVYADTNAGAMSADDSGRLLDPPGEDRLHGNGSLGDAESAGCGPHPPPTTPTTCSSGCTIRPTPTCR